MFPELLQRVAPAAIAGLTACSFTLVLSPLVRLLAVRFGWVARPEDDRWGRRIVARLGGVAMFGGLLAAVLLWMAPSREILGLLIGLSLIFVLGLVDDLRRLPPYTKLLGQLLIGCTVISLGIRFQMPQWSWLAIPLSVLWFVLIMNAFNLLDNMDGLAAGVGAIGAGFCAVHAALVNQWAVVVFASAVVGSCLGFLRYNFPPARMFMGDSGSHVLGLSLAVLATMSEWRHSTQLLSVLAVPTLVLAVPIFDTCFVTVQRLAHGQHPFVGGTDHVSHRLAILGLSVRQTVLALYGLSGLLGLLSVLSLGLKPLVVLAVWLSVLTVLLLVGGYLAHVSVYRLEAAAEGPASASPMRPSTFIDTMLLHKRRLVEVLADFLLISCAYVFAYLLRFEGSLTGDLQVLIMQSLPIILVIKLVCFASCGLYRGMWRYLSLSDVLTVLKAVTIGSLLSAVALLYLWRFEGYSRAVLIIDWLVCILAIGGSRVVERLLDEWVRAAAPVRPIPVLIIGAGDTGERVLRHLRDERSAPQRVVGFLDDDLRKHGNWMHGVSVLGGRHQLARVLDANRVREVLVAISDPPGELLQHVRRCCELRGIPWKVVTAGVMHTV